MSVFRRKLVIVGDRACRETCLLSVFAKDEFPVYIPTIFKGCVADFVVDGRCVELALWDTAVHKDYEHLRPLS